MYDLLVLLLLLPFAIFAAFDGVVCGCCVSCACCSWCFCCCTCYYSPLLTGISHVYMHVFVVAFAVVVFVVAAVCLCSTGNLFVFHFGHKLMPL